MRDGRWYGTSISTLGVALVAAAGLLLLVMLYQFVGPFRYLDPSPALPERQVALWLPAEASSQQPATARRIDGWRRVLPEAGALRRGPGLPRPPAAFVVVVPDARRLDGSGQGALLDFARGGGGVVLTGSFGVRDASDSWRGYEGMGRVLGVERVEPLSTLLTSALLAGERGPLAGALAPDTPVQLMPEAGLPAIPAEGAELVWSEGSLEPRVPLGAEPGVALGASRRLEIGRGRLVWVAAGPENGTQASLPDLDRVLRAAVDWAACEPIVALLPPEGAPGPTASARDRAEAWRRIDETLDTAVTRAGSERLLVSVTNRGRDPLEGIALELWVGGAVESAAVKATVLGQELPELRPWPAEDRLELRLPALRPGSHAWNIEWTESPARREST